jgi:putative ABC transport system permease protein
MVSMGSFLEGLRQDLAYGTRSLRRSRGPTALAVLTLAVGISVATAMFSVLDGVLLRELPVRQQHQLVVMWLAANAGGVEHVPIEYQDLVAFRSASHTMQSAAGVNFQGASDLVMRDADTPIPLAAAWVTGNFFSVLGVEPPLGRLLQPADDVPGAAPAMVISYAFWQRQFGGARTVLGHILASGARSYTIVGVLPRGFEYPQRTDAWFAVLPWFPGTTDPRLAASAAIQFDLVGRLGRGFTPEQAQAEFAAYLRSTDSSRPVDARGRRPIATSLLTVIAGSMRPIMWTASGAVVLLLLIACINVANLLLIRGSARGPELAVRAALGATQRRLSRQLLMEGGVLASAAGAIGVGLAALIVRILVTLAPAELPRREVIGLDGPVLIFALVTTLATLVLAGLMPALVTARRDLHTWLRSGRGNPSNSRVLGYLRQALVVGQIALAFLVAIGAGLLTRSLIALERVDMAFNANGLVIMETGLATAGDLDHAHQLALTEDMVTRVAAIPGVLGATTMPKPPFSAQGGWLAWFTGDGQRAAAAANNPLVNLEVVGPQYFETLEIPIRRGRAFDGNDRQHTLPVAIVSDAIARRSWPGEDPIGKRVKLGAPSDSVPWLTIVGVVGETRYHELTRPEPSLYLPARQFDGIVPMTLAVRTRGDPARLMPEIRDALMQVNAALAPVRGGTMRQLLAAPLARPRFSTVLLSAFATITVLLTLVGIYGALATAVTQRQREIGIRLALGAAISQVYGLVLGDGLRLAAIGCGLGVLGALAGTRVIASLLYGVAPTDLVTFAVVTGCVLVSSALACYLPARRAARVDPLLAIRTEM